MAGSGTVIVCCRRSSRGPTGRTGPDRRRGRSGARALDSNPWTLDPDLMDFNEFSPERRFRAAWQAVEIARSVPYSLFTFGESDLPYYLVVDADESGEPVHITQGEVKVTRPMIITPDNVRPEWEGFFEGHEFDEAVQFLLSRTAAFKHLKVDNVRGPDQIVSDSVEEVVSRLNHKLDADDEDRVAILTAPHGLGGVAVLRYAAERILESAPGNIQELRERGFLPD